MFDIIKVLLRKDTRCFLRNINRELKQDKNYSIFNLFRAVRHFGRHNKIGIYKNKIVLGFVIPPIPSKQFLTFLYATPEKSNIYTQNALLQKTAPLTVSLGITDKCGYNCIYCSKEGRTEGEELTKQEWIDVIKILQDMGTPVITFVGGEPLLRDDIIEIIQSVDDRSMCLLFTSGQRLTAAKAAELKAAGLYGVTVSLDSYNEAEQNFRRGSEYAFKNSVDGIKNAINAGLYTCASCVVSKEMLVWTEMKKLFDFFNNFGVHEIILIPPFNSGKWMGKNDEFYSDADKKSLLRFLKKGNRKYKVKISSELSNCNINYFGCAAGIQHSHINPYGELFPCEIAPLSFGNVRTGNLKKMWERMRDAIRKPHCQCLADEAFLMLEDEILPVGIEKSIEICELCKTDQYPDVYKKLLGGKH